MARNEAKLINVEKVKEFSEHLTGVPWTYEPSVAEVNAITQLKNIIEEYLNYLKETSLVAVCGHCGARLLPDGKCPGLCTPTERDV